VGNEKDDYGGHRLRNIKHIVAVLIGSIALNPITIFSNIVIVVLRSIAKSDVR
jgi:hypothetical protein